MSRIVYSGKRMGHNMLYREKLTSDLSAGRTPIVATVDQIRCLAQMRQWFPTRPITLFGEWAVKIHPRQWGE